ncbi:hypothetical protein SNEBB_007372 [Seison nebaliae]|nr:hypothetical protein SNEBB_007372 [Seison nebaliae]
MQNLSLILLLVSTAINCAEEDGEFKVVKFDLKNPNDDSEYKNGKNLCGRIEPTLSTMLDEEDYKFMGVLHDARPYAACANDTPVLLAYVNTALLVARGDCSADEKLKEVYEAYEGKVQTIIIADDNRYYPEKEKKGDYGNLTIISMIEKQIDDAYNGDVRNLSAIHMVGVKTIPVFNPSTILILALAYSSLMFGCVWAYKEEKHYIQMLQAKAGDKDNLPDKSISQTNVAEVADNDNENNNNNKLKKIFKKKRRVHKDCSSWMTYKFPNGWPKIARGTPIATVILFLVGVVALYFWYTQTIWFFIFIFLFMSPISLYRGVMFLMTFSKKAMRRTEKRLFLYRNIRCCSFKMGWAQVMIVTACYGVGIAWLFLRSNPHGWIIHTVLAFFFAADVIRSSKIKSWKYITFILLGAILWDAFTVYITPFFTRNGFSVMEYIARGPELEGGDTTELLTIVFRIPFLPYAEPCLGDVTDVLYLGDSIVPGIAVSSTFIWELMNERNWNPKLFILAYMGYVVALAGVFALAILTKTSQSPFMFTLPIIWISVTIYTLVTGEFVKYWNADPYYDVLISEGDYTYDEDED